MLSYRLGYTELGLVPDGDYNLITVPPNSFYIESYDNGYGSSQTLVGIPVQDGDYYLNLLGVDGVQFTATLDFEKFTMGYTLFSFFSMAGEFGFEVSGSASERIYSELMRINNLITLDSVSSSDGSLNGRYGSLKDGTHVTVIGRDNMEFVVVSSDFIYQDSSSGYYMLNYTLKKVDDNAHIVVPDKLLKPIVTP